MWLPPDLVRATGPSRSPALARELSFPLCPHRGPAFSEYGTRGENWASLTPRTAAREFSLETGASLPTYCTTHTKNCKTKACRSAARLPHFGWGSAWPSLVAQGSEPPAREPVWPPACGSRGPRACADRPAPDTLIRDQAGGDRAMHELHARKALHRMCGIRGGGNNAGLISPGDDFGRGKFRHPCPTHTLHCPTHTLHCPTHTLHCPTHTLHCPTHTLHCPTHTLHCPTHTLHCPTHTLHCPTHTLHCPTHTALPHAHTALPKPPGVAGGKFRHLL